MLYHRWRKEAGRAPSTSRLRAAGEDWTAEARMASRGVGMQEGRLSSNSLVATIGLSLYTVWMLFVCFWMLGFPEGPHGLATSAVERLGAFVGVALGLLVIGLLGKNPSFNVFDRKVLVAVAAASALLPSASAALSSVFPLSEWAVFACFALSTAAGAFVQVCWLDVFSRFDLSKLGLSLGASTAAGVVVFLLLASMPWYAQDMAASVCILTSVGLVAYSTQTAPCNEERAPLESTHDRWEFTREIEPSLLLFGMVFSLSFFFLLGRNPGWLLVGAGGIALGAVALVAADLSKHVFRITSVQRLVTVVTVATCLLMPLESEPLRVALSIVIAAACSFLVIANSVFLIRKICVPRSVPVFRAIPKRLFVFALGFALGWLVATAVALVPGGDLSVIKYIRLGIAILLVATMMVFLPVERHHEDTASSAGGKQAYASETEHAQRTALPGEGDAGHSPLTATPMAANPVRPESETFDAKCAAIARLYQLSPREAEILPYLAKGRNNAYLQDKFVISSHTAKSHIYNIYRKLDIHSQQKLMDFVEEFPEDYEV